MLRVRNDGVPAVGLSCYSLTDQTDRDSALREKKGNVNPVGLYDLDRRIRPVCKAYKKLIAQWRDVLPTQSMCLTVPVVLPDEASGRHARRQKARAQEMIKDDLAEPAVQDRG